MSQDIDALARELISELPALVFTTGDPVINYLAPNALHKLANLETLRRTGQDDDAKRLIERDLRPTLAKLEEVLGELAKRAPALDMAAVGRVMTLCREFQEAHPPELERSHG
ncbi:MAG TPA: hypothetical protein VEC38_00925 [Candidatus Binataceae bacterium]|nr:hypothetical protein [Candidatus Binataceae bacterium]